MSKRKKMLTAEEIKAAALDQPEDVRDALLDEFERQSGAPAISPAVLAEAERRMEAVQSGRAKAIPFEELMAELERDL